MSPMHIDSLFGTLTIDRERLWDKLLNRVVNLIIFLFIQNDKYLKLC